MFMPRLLHLLTKENDGLATEVISAHRALPECHIEIVDLTQGEPDYRALLERIFEADSVQVW